MTSITPLQRQRIPAMERLISMALLAPVTAASATASRFPVVKPNSKDRMTIPVQTHVMAMTVPPSDFVNLL